MKHFVAKVFLWAAVAFTLVGCRANVRESATTDPNRVARMIARNFVESGATACRYNVEDMLVHATAEVTAAVGQMHLPEADVERRPSSAMYVLTRADGATSHLQVSFGKDASGFCSLQWSDTRVWNRSCAYKQADYLANGRLKAEQLGQSTVLTGERAVGILLTPLSKRRCLVTEFDAAWRIDPDEAARDWIKEDHGYDPLEDPPP